MESKVKPNLLLVVVKYGLDVVWYLSIVFTIVAVVFIVGKLNDPPNVFLINVEYHGELRESYKPLYESITSVEFQPTYGKLSMKGEGFLFQKMVWIYIFSLIMFALYFVFFFYLRKIFTSFMCQSPFCMDNVKRIRMLSYCLVVFNLLLLLWKWHFVTQMTNLSSYSYNYSMSIPGDFGYIFIALVLYILADVFKYGFQIQEENNKFI
jgi:hypothetical protein